MSELMRKMRRKLARLTAFRFMSDSAFNAELLRLFARRVGDPKVADFLADEEHRFIGRSVPRPDLDDKIAGRPIFLQEQHPAGMLYGCVVRPPAYTARLMSLDTAPIERMPGVVKVVRVFETITEEELKRISAQPLSPQAQPKI